MERRRFGRTNHNSTIAIFGAAAFYDISQEDANKTLEKVIAAGVNHIDVAPGYGQAEERLGPWMPEIRSRCFLGCKTMERGKEGAADELRRSMEIMQVDKFDLYQLHAVTSMEELDQVTASGGALEAVIEARAEGLTDYIGITGHGNHVPAVFLEALDRFDFDTVLFPINFVQYANPEYRQNSDELIRQCHEKDIGVMVIKSIAKLPWGERKRSYNTWYEPFDDPSQIQQGINFALSQNVTGLCTSADVTILPMFLDACERFVHMDMIQQEELIATSADYETIFD
jgi:predicted aldo/keto reductase-like oxidoreductase